MTVFDLRYLRCRAIGGEVAGLSPLRRGDMPGLAALEARDAGLGLRFDQGTRTVSCTAGGVTHTLTFDLDQGGMVTSWLRGAVELLAAPDGQRGLQGKVEWTDLHTGDWTRHSAVQGADLNGVGGNCFGFYEQVNADGSVTVTVDYIPVEEDPAGTRGVPYVNSWHGGGVVYWNTVPCQLRIDLCVGGQADVHEIKLDVMPNFEAVTVGHDVNAQVVLFANTAVYPNLLAWDGSTRTTMSQATSGVDYYQADFRGYMMDDTKLVGDEEADDTSLVGSAGFLSAAAGTGDSDLAVALGGVLGADPKTGARRLGDSPGGNAWRWMQNHGGADGPTAPNFVAIGFGQCLSSRLQAATALRTFGREAGPTVDATLLTGTNVTNETVAL